MSKAMFQGQGASPVHKPKDKRHDGQRKAAERKQAARQSQQHNNASYLKTTIGGQKNEGRHFVPPVSLFPFSHFLHFVNLRRYPVCGYRHHCGEDSSPYNINNGNK